MKKLLALLAVLAIVLTTCVMGIGTVASAAEESPEADFVVFDGVLEEYLGVGGDVVIPASLGVTEIAADCFRLCSELTSIVIPEGVEVLGLRAFWTCENLQSVTLPYSLYEIGQEAFCSSALTEITIPPQVEIVPYGCFQGSYFLSDIKFSYGVERIHGGAFGGSIATKVIFPETVEFIGGVAFNYVRSNGRVEWIICNPDCEIGYYALGSGLEKDWANQNLSDRPMRPINNTLHPGMNVTFTVPRDSAIGKFIDENKDIMLDRSNTYNDAAACAGTTYRVSYKDPSYFKDLEENQKGYGIKEPVSSGNGTTGDTTPEQGEEYGPGEEGDKGTSGNKNNNNKNNGGNTTYIEQEKDNSSMIMVLAIVGGVILLIIIGVVVFLVIYMKKPKAPAYPPYGYPPYGYPPVGPDGQPIQYAPQAPVAPAPEAAPEAAPVEEAPVDETPTEE